MGIKKLNYYKCVSGYSYIVKLFIAQRVPGCLGSDWRIKLREVPTVVAQLKLKLKLNLT